MAENNSADEQSAESRSSGVGTAMKAAAAAGASGAAAIAVRRALASSSRPSRSGSSWTSEDSTVGSLLRSITSGSWKGAREALLPLAEDAASAAGTYAAKNGPGVVRDKILPSFISSFNDARGEA